MHKTFKREVAVAGLGFWALVTYRVFWQSTPEEIEALSAAYGTASTSIWLFAAAAFGMDSWFKQTPFGSSPLGRAAQQKGARVKPADEPPSAYVEKYGGS